MKREDIIKPNPEALEKASQLINDLVKKSPSGDFFEKIEDTEDKKPDNNHVPKVALPFSENNQSIQQ